MVGKSGNMNKASSTTVFFLGKNIQRLKSSVSTDEEPRLQGVNTVSATY